jgi:hypothetical protein
MLTSRTPPLTSARTQQISSVHAKSLVMAAEMNGRAKPTDQASLGRLILVYAVMLAIVFICIETMSFVAITLIKSRFVFQGVFYDPSVVTQNYDEYLEKRDIKLGWRPPPAPNAWSTAADGTRHDPGFSIDAQPCLSLFGDSFTWSDRVADKDAWGSILSAKLKCRVANFGVSGFGTDQAFLRFRSFPPKGGVAFLNHLSENIMRNVNQFLNLIYPSNEFDFKPRFVDRNGGVELVPIPEVAAPDIQGFLKDPALYLPNEYFLPDGPSGIQAIKFPYSLVLLKAIFQNHHVYTKLTGIPRYAEFYRPEHPSHGLEVTYGILRSFAREAAARGQIPIVTFVPTCGDLAYFNTTGVFPYDRLTKMIAAQNIRYIDFGEQIAKRIKGSPPKNLYRGTCSSYSGYHFNEVGYRLLAEIAFEYLMSNSEIKRRLPANAGQNPAMTAVPQKRTLP